MNSHEYKENERKELWQRKMFPPETINYSPWIRCTINKASAVSCTNGTPVSSQQPGRVQVSPWMIIRVYALQMVLEMTPLSLWLAESWTVCELLIISTWLRARNKRSFSISNGIISIPRQTNAQWNLRSELNRWKNLVNPPLLNKSSKIFRPKLTNRCFDRNLSTPYL